MVNAAKDLDQTQSTSHVTFKRTVRGLQSIGGALVFGLLASTSTSGCSLEPIGQGEEENVGEAEQALMTDAWCVHSTMQTTYPDGTPGFSFNQYYQYECWGGSASGFDTFAGHIKYTTFPDYLWVGDPPPGQGIDVNWRTGVIRPNGTERIMIGGGPVHDHSYTGKTTVTRGQCAATPCPTCYAVLSSSECTGPSFALPNLDPTRRKDGAPCKTDPSLAQPDGVFKQQDCGPTQTSSVASCGRCEKQDSSRGRNRDPDCPELELDPVDIEDGSLKEPISCMALSGRGMHVSTFLHYDSRLVWTNTSSQALSPGWAVSHTRRLQHFAGNQQCLRAGDVNCSGTTGCVDTPDYVILSHELGERTTFYAAQTLNGTTTFLLPGTTLATPQTSRLERSSNGTYKLTYADGTFDEFDSQGTLSAQQDTFGNRVVISTVNNVTTIASWPQGATQPQQAFELVQGDNGFGRRKLIEIRDAAINVPSGQTARKITLGYNANHYLTSITDQIGRVYRYEYDSRGLMTKRFDPNNNPQNPMAVFTENVFEPEQSPPPAPVHGGSTAVTMCSDLPAQSTYVAPRKPRLVKQSQKRVNGTLLRFVDLTWDTNGSDGAGNTWDTVFAYKNAAGSTLETQRYRHGVRGKVDRIYVRDSTVAFEERVWDPNTGLLNQVKDPDGKVAAFTYDANGNLIKRTRAPGTPLESNDFFEYNANGQLAFSKIHVRDIFYRQAWYTYDSTTRALLSVRNCSSATPSLCPSSTDWMTTFAYNSRGQLTTQMMPNGLVIQTEYNDAWGNPTRTVVDPTGAALEETRTYDWRGFVTQSRDQNGVVTHYVRDAAGRMLEAQRTIREAPFSGAQVRTQYTYDAANNILSIVKAAGTSDAMTTTMTYELAGFEAKYDLRSMSVQGAFVGPFSTHFESDALGRRTVIRDPMNRVTTMSYSRDANGFVTINTLRAGHTNPSIQRLRPNGAVERVEDELGIRQVFAYDERGNLKQKIRTNVSASTPSSLPIQFDYDVNALGELRTTRSEGRLVVDTIPDGYGRAIQYRFYPVGTSHLAGTARKIFWERDDTNNRITKKFGNDLAIQQTEIEQQDKAGRVLAKTLDATSTGAGQRQTTYAYSTPAERLAGNNYVRVTDPNGNTKTILLSDFGGVRGIVDEAQNQITQVVRNARGEVVRTEVIDYPGGVAVSASVASYLLDGMGRLAQEHLTNTTGPSYVLNADGSLSEAIAPNGGANEIYTYDAAGRVCRLDRAPYGGSGCSAGTANSADDVEYTYLDNDLLATVKDFQVVPASAGGATTTYTYDLLGRRATKTRTANGVSRTITYTYKANTSDMLTLDYWSATGSGRRVEYTTNEFGEIRGMRDWDGQFTNLNYSTLGEILSMYMGSSQLGGTGGAVFMSRAFNGLGDLVTNEYRTGNNASNLFLQQFAGAGYPGRDAAGNIRTNLETYLNEATLATSFTYDNHQRLSSAAYPAIPWGGATAASVSFAYTGAGDLTRTPSGQTALSYLRNGMWTGRITNVGFAYDDFGNLTAKPALP